jgi:hypothetical protein
MLNLYEFYNKPERLYFFEHSHLIRLIDHQDIRNDVDWTPALHILKKSPMLCYLYAYHVLKGRWIEAEPNIMMDSWQAYNYARDIIKDRWIEAEPNIMKNVSIAYRYAKDIIKGRWIEAEPYIRENEYFWNEYTEEFKL